MVGHYKRVYDFVDILDKAINEADIWDNVKVFTEVDTLLPKTFTDGKTQYDLLTKIKYTDSDGDECEVGFILTSTNFDIILETEEKVRKIIPAIFE